MPTARSPRRLSVGLEQNRLAMLLAVIHAAGVVCFDQMSSTRGMTPNWQPTWPSAGDRVLPDQPAPATRAGGLRRVSAGWRDQAWALPGGQVNVSRNGELGFSVALVLALTPLSRDILGMR